MADAESTLVFDDPFFRELLSHGCLKPDFNVPAHLVDAICVVVARATESQLPPFEAKGLVALVVAALKKDGFSICPPATENAQ